jgi:hypothetical protein
MEPAVAVAAGAPDLQHVQPDLTEQGDTFAHHFAS